MNKKFLVFFGFFLSVGFDQVKAPGVRQSRKGSPERRPVVRADQESFSKQFPIITSSLGIGSTTKANGPENVEQKPQISFLQRFLQRIEAKKAAAEEAARREAEEARNPLIQGILGEDMPDEKAAKKKNSRLPRPQQVFARESGSPRPDIDALSKALKEKRGEKQNVSTGSMPTARVTYTNPALEKRNYSSEED